ncbi:olfactory receptor 14C36-like [Elgaria multicarinata webbii]|uniref:olfactory receptor 14C36-like n=1 Tax=Elgaria multicarinata webbii TaxID=159646 RepID=UPI002FCCEFC0
MASIFTCNIQAEGVRSLILVIPLSLYFISCNITVVSPHPPIFFTQRHKLTPCQKEMENLSTLTESTTTEFTLLGFSDIRELQILHFVAFLSIYLVALMGNLLIILIVAYDHQLHGPMYFFLVNLAVSDVCYISITIPKSMTASLTNIRLISFYECVFQVFLVITFAGVELSFLTVMAYDRYVAICHPLQYSMIMNWKACFQMAAASLISSAINATIHTVSTFRLQFCKFNIQQFFCNVPQLWMLSCTDPVVSQSLVIASAFTVALFCLLFILVSYGFIFSTVLKIQSAQGRHKVFSTCTPHLIVLSLFFTTAAFSYLRPKALSSPPADLMAAVLYTVLPPLVNPIVYSLRNKEIYGAMSKMSKKYTFHRVISCTFPKKFKFSGRETN